MTNPTLSVRDLRIAVPQGDDLKQLLHGVSFFVHPGEALGLVGESGSGKSLSCRSVVGLYPARAAVEGEIVLQGTSLMELSRDELRNTLSGAVSMIFQDPRAHINPIHTIGDFLIEGVVQTQRVSKREALARAEGLLREVGMTDPRRRLQQYPHELSGGMLQRVMIASALMTDPSVILADEPTTALDVTTQEEVMAILDELRRERNMAMVFITHDLDLAAAVCDRIAVMRDGRIIEELPADSIYEDATNPYTRTLVDARVGFAHEVRSDGGEDV